MQRDQLPVRFPSQQVQGPFFAIGQPHARCRLVLPGSRGPPWGLRCYWLCQNDYVRKLRHLPCLSIRKHITIQAWMWIKRKLWYNKYFFISYFFSVFNDAEIKQSYINKYTMSKIRIYNHTQIWIAHINHLSVSFSSSNGSKKSFLDLVPQGHNFMQVRNVIQ